MHPLDEMHDAVTVENFGFSSLNSDTQRKLTAVSSSLNDIKTCRLLSGEEEIEDRMEKLNRHKEQVKSDGKPWALRADALVGKNQRPFRYIPNGYRILANRCELQRMLLWMDLSDNMRSRCSAYL